MRTGFVLLFALSTVALSAQDGTAIRKIGGNVSAPVVLFAPEPAFSDAARAAAASGTPVDGNVLIHLQVDVNGAPTHVRVLRGIGMGLDEKAMEAVRLYKFRPAMENGVAVPVELNIEVHFQIVNKPKSDTAKPPI